jgi:hypothetical protein
MLFCLACALLAGTRPAFADAWYSFVQITCIPETQYFALRTFGQENAPRAVLGLGPDIADRARALERYGVYTPEGLSQRPFTCTMPSPLHGPNQGPALTVVVSGSYTPPRAGGMGAGAATEKVAVTVNGLDTGEFDLGNWKVELITASGDGVGIVVEKCVVDNGAPSVVGSDQPRAVQSECRQWKLP